LSFIIDFIIKKDIPTGEKKKDKPVKIYDYKLFAMLRKFFQKSRMDKFKDIFYSKKESIILDVGGLIENWKLIKGFHRIIILNIHLPPPGYQLDGAIWIVGDGTKLPFKKNTFEVVYSNSVIEHLNDLKSQQEFAEEIRRVGVNYFVQTPNKYFFVEQHFLLPFIHFFPKSLQRMVARKLDKLGLVYGEDLLTSIKLLSYNDLRRLFPDSVIIREKVFFMTKSLIAIKKEVSQ
jgi:hypothetical protein